MVAVDLVTDVCDACPSGNLRILHYTLRSTLLSGTFFQTKYFKMCRGGEPYSFKKRR
jgi:hypothetical protein